MELFMYLFAENFYFNSTTEISFFKVVEAFQTAFHVRELTSSKSTQQSSDCNIISTLSYKNR